MKKNNFFFTLLNLTFCLTLLLNYSCSSNDDNNTTTNPSPIALPTVITTNVSSITLTSSISGGNINSDGGSNIISKGICWNTSTNPTIALTTKTIDGSGKDNFVSSLFNLNHGTKYYLRAYATNSLGTSYGNEINFTTKAQIGDNCQGGIVAYILQPEDTGYDKNIQHGIIATISETQGNIWGCEGVSISGAASTAIGSGNQNTISIINNCSTLGIFARTCSDLILDEYSDWYLPSKDELSILYKNKSIIGGFTETNVYYISSSERDATYYWGCSFDGKFTFNSKNRKIGGGLLGYRIRPIRSF